VISYFKSLLEGWNTRQEALRLQQLLIDAGYEVSSKLTW
jgi:hypothetical protein